MTRCVKMHRYILIQRRRVFCKGETESSFNPWVLPETASCVWQTCTHLPVRQLDGDRYKRGASDRWGHIDEADLLRGGHCRTRLVLWGCNLWGETCRLQIRLPFPWQYLIFSSADFLSFCLPNVLYDHHHILDPRPRPSGLDIDPARAQPPVASGDLGSSGRQLRAHDRGSIASKKRSGSRYPGAASVV